MLDIRGLTVGYGAQTAVRELSLAAADTEVLGVIGPSGCGKSTLLRAVAGLQRPRSGQVLIDDRDVTGLRPDQRRIGLMFQEHALFPHRNVADNVAFGLRMQRLPRTEIAERVGEALDVVDLAGLERRSVTELSGGERQRVALARTIAPRPRLLMLDEPLGSLDRALQDRLLQDLPSLFAALGTTVVYVTHDQHEALTLADRVAVMREGRLVRVGAPHQVWRDPRTTFVATFLGLRHIVTARVRGRVVETPWGVLPAPPAPDGGEAVDGEHPLTILPSALRLATDTDPCRDGEHAVTADVQGLRFAGDHLVIDAQPSGAPPLKVAVRHDEPPRTGDRVTVAIAADGVRLLTEDR